MTKHTLLKWSCNKVCYYIAQINLINPTVQLQNSRSKTIPLPALIFSQKTDTFFKLTISANQYDTVGNPSTRNYQKPSDSVRIRLTESSPRPACTLGRSGSSRCWLQESIPLLFSWCVDFDATKAIGAAPETYAGGSICD